MSDDTKEYAVGYGKPPKATQFKKGRSGNPKGRPKASKNVGSMLEEVFFRKIPITENGSRREVTMLEAILRQLVNGAVKGEMRSIDRVLKLLPTVQEARRRVGGWRRCNRDRPRFRHGRPGSAGGYVW
ncbi:DUF5681 domain-containing protein [Ruegeria lacuscaerulensis]|uniref:DUF5681 domain-containing protein n=1 Tax=Ruegeria lacuscaerulensis TaxID=55218 RepID=UPI00147BBCEB|nr:DUF5681 domain-containing protein [Ruegeria lacuscaerulensis]